MKRNFLVIKANKSSKSQNANVNRGDKIYAQTLARVHVRAVVWRRFCLANQNESFIEVLSASFPLREPATEFSGILLKDNL